MKALHGLWLLFVIITVAGAARWLTHSQPPAVVAHADVTMDVFHCYQEELDSSSTEFGTDALFSTGQDTSGLTLELVDAVRYQVVYWSPSQHVIVSCGDYRREGDQVRLTDDHNQAKLVYRIANDEGGKVCLKPVSTPAPSQIVPWTYLPVAVTT